jgi:hypothetical protein
MPSVLDVPSNLDYSLLNKVPIPSLGTIDINSPTGWADTSSPTFPTGGGSPITEPTTPAETPTTPVDTTPVGALPVDTTPVPTTPVGALPVAASPITEPTTPAETPTIPPTVETPLVDMSAASFLAIDPTTGNGIYILDGKLVNADGSTYTGDSSINMFVNGSPTDTTPTAVTPTDTIPADTTPAVDMSNAVFIATDPVTGTGVYTLDGKLVNADGSAYTGDSSSNMFVNGSPTDTTPTDTTPKVEAPTVEAPTVETPTVEAPTVETPTVEDHVYVGGNAEPTTPTDTTPPTETAPTETAPTETPVVVPPSVTPTTPSATGGGGALPTAATTAATPTQQTSTTQSTAAPAATPAVAPLSYLTPTMLAGAPVTPQMTAQIAQLKQLYPQLQGVSDKILSSLIASEPKTAADNSSQLMSSGLSSISNASPSTASRGSLVGQDANSNLMQAGLSMLNPGSSLATPHFAKGGHVEDHVPEFITGATGHYVKGRGDGQSDDIPAMLADGEYVFDADTVAALGNGSSDAGAKALDKMREAIRKHKRSAPVNKIPPKAKSPLEYFKGR